MAVVWLTLVLAGCGQGSSVVGSPSASPSPSGVPTPSEDSPRPDVLYAVLEARNNLPASSGAQGQQHNVVAIAGLDGYARAKSTFKPRQVPVVGNAATLLAPEAVIASGSVYFIDGTGVVRRLGPAGDVAAVASFPLTQKQQEVSFAVSPDGQKIVAASLTLPDIQWPPPPSPAPSPTSAGSYVLQVLEADAGGPTTVLSRWDSVNSPDMPGGGGFQMLRLVGWDGDGPVALVGAYLGTQNGLFDRQTLFGGRFAHLDLKTGLARQQILGACPGGPANGTWTQPWSISPDGLVVCAVMNAKVSVRKPDATKVLETSYPGPHGLGGSFALSPNGRRLAMDGQVVDVAGTIIGLPPSFRPQGWLDNVTVVGGIAMGPLSRCHGSFELGFVRLSAPNQVQDLGFCADFVGVVN